MELRKAEKSMLDGCNLSKRYELQTSPQKTDSENDRAGEAMFSSPILDEHGQT